MNIEKLDLSVRAYNCVKRSGINTIEELLNKSDNEIFCIRNIGTKVANEVIQAKIGWNEREGLREDLKADQQTIQSLEKLVERFEKSDRKLIHIREVIKKVDEEFGILMAINEIARIVGE